jgi:hypothetical protein
MAPSLKALTMLTIRYGCGLRAAEVTRLTVGDIDSAQGMAPRPTPVRMLMSFGTNLLVSQPDTAIARKALAALEFHVHADFFVNATAREADIVLPAATSWEREGLRTAFDASLEVCATFGCGRLDRANRRGSFDTDAVLRRRATGTSREMFDLDVDSGHEVVLAKSGLTVADLRRAPAGIDVKGHVVFDAHTTSQRHCARVPDADAQD